MLLEQILPFFARDNTNRDLERCAGIFVVGTITCVLKNKHPRHLKNENSLIEYGMCSTKQTWLLHFGYEVPAR